MQIHFVGFEHDFGRLGRWRLVGRVTGPFQLEDENSPNICLVVDDKYPSPHYTSLLARVTAGNQVRLGAVFVEASGNQEFGHEQGQMEKTEGADGAANRRGVEEGRHLRRHQEDQTRPDI